MAAAFSSTLYMYNAIFSTKPENKLYRGVNSKSGMAALNALLCGHFIIHTFNT